MPIEITVDESRNLTVFRCSGELNQDDYRSAIIQYYQQHLRPNTLWDLREARLDLRGTDVAELARMATRLALEHKQERQGGKTVAVTPRSLDFGMARMYESYASDSPVAFHVCRDWDEAISFLEK